MTGRVPTARHGLEAGSGPACAVPAALVSTAGCESPAEDLGATIRDSAGVQIVESSRPRDGESLAWSVASTPSLQIGSGPPEQQLHRVQDATRLDDGRVVVLNGGNELRLYDPEGQFLRTAAGAGEGPGELRSASEIVRLRGDTMLVYGYGLGRLNTFGPDGQFLDSRPLQLRTLPGFDQPPLSAEGAHLWAEDVALVHLYDWYESMPEGMFRPRKTMAWVDLETMTADTVEGYGGTQQQMVDLAAADRPIPVFPPLERRSVTAGGGEPFRLLVGNQSAPEFHEYRDGQLRRIVRWARDPRPFTESELEAWRARHMEWLAGTGSGGPSVGLTRSEAERVLSAADLPPSRPPYADLHVDSRGCTWVGDARLEFRDPGRYRIPSPDGRWLGAVTLPPLSVLEIGEDYVLGLFRDDLDVQHLRVYRLER